MRVAQVADQAGDTATALTWFDLALALDPRDAALYYWRSLTWERAGDLTASLADTEQALIYATPAERERILFQQGRMTAKLGDWSGAMPIFRELSWLAPDNYLYHFWLARAYTILGAAEAAEAAFAAAVARAGIQGIGQMHYFHGVSEMHE